MKFNKEKLATTTKEVKKERSIGGKTTTKAILSYLSNSHLMSECVCVDIIRVVGFSYLDIGMIMSANAHDV